ncbi:hypothetical protein [Aeromicrobium sp. Leaf350]|uniref:hypothetical protein n=1 Tax=Aeromicrobium sp. Leaf350 TaxID=2876565 RepID=UPI001E5D9228|nr:hypothetical protein [Aeromicrobium sp. Leaf350]
MKNTTTAATAIRGLVLAAALTVGGLALGAGAASADPIPFGPTTLGQPQPGPVQPGPGDIAQPQPGPVEPNVPQGPGDIAQPEPGPVVNPDVPQGPGDITNPAPCPTHGGCGGTGPQQGPSDLSAGTPTTVDPGTVETVETETAQEVPEVATPTRVDAGLGPVDDGNGLAWLLLSGSAVGLSGAAYGARRLIGRHA